MENNYNEKRDRARQIYKRQKSVFCPALDEVVTCDERGFDHIIHKNRKHIRDIDSQLNRFECLPIALKVIALTTTIQEEQLEKQGKLFKKEITYWGFIAIIQGMKLKVVIRKVGNGKMHFWSVIPCWTTSKKRDTKFISG